MSFGDFAAVEVKSGKYFYHYFTSERAFVNWRSRPVNRGKDVRPESAVGNLPATRARHLDTDHYLEFDLED